MRKACRTELQVFCSESLWAREIIDFPKSQFILILWEKKKKKVCLCSKLRLLSYYENLNESKKSIIHPAASFTQTSCTLCKERKRSPSKKPEQRIVHRLCPIIYVWGDRKKIYEQITNSTRNLKFQILWLPRDWICSLITSLVMVNAENSHFHWMTIMLL